MIELYGKMRAVKRFHHEPTLRTQNLLEHSGMVALLFIHFAKLENMKYNAETIEIVLKHDLVETLTGDLPYPAKNYNNLTKDCWGAIERSLVKESGYYDLEGTPLLSRYTDDGIRSRMSPVQYTLLKVVDLLEIWIFLKEEIVLGNTTKSCARIIALCESKILRKFNSVDKYMLTANYF